MPVHDQDLEVLETYLDDELSDVEMNALRLRLANEPELADALNELRLARATRGAVWNSYEPAASDTELLMADLRREMVRSMVNARVARFTGIFSAAAACVLLSFMGGYIYRGGANNAAPSPNDGPGNLVWTNPGALSGFSPTDVMNKPNPAAQGYLVSFTDAQGRLLGTQRFRTLQEAQEFMRDWQLRQLQQSQPVRPMQNNGIKMVADEF